MMDGWSLSMEEINLLRLCRKILYGLMKLKWGDGEPHSGDGELVITFPEYTCEIRGTPIYMIRLYTCSLGNHHDYTWEGSSLYIALGLCKKQLELWVQES